MTKIALTAAAILIATASAFAGSDKFGSNSTNQSAAPVASLDETRTTSIQKPDAIVAQPATPGSDRNLFGNR
ncbi:DUF680 domain-containing protein [Mesorhizobium sp. INR15]|uniref:DUF680 domain-containing protein n=1 Tax=Mesorhizobium sp. INR15 TaxID=2654248 RepID=UPI0018968D4C|nr:DUF680 domain-containing protein [Mesorhizobium sp. INR15]QPC90448.1 DUF680 domain-containing protein [Mesorhizobium sp. INR15]